MAVEAQQTAELIDEPHIPEENMKTFLLNIKG